MKTPKLTYEQMIENFSKKFPKAKIKFIIDSRLIK